ncbi:MAG: YdeI/OmpD-associated family protein [Paracoccaceae bacterium]
MDVNPDKIESFATPADFCAWLAENHRREDELWLKIYKKGSGRASVDWQEAVIEALAWGWIDGIKKSHDESAYFQRFTPRRKKSVWSQKNRAHVEALIESGRMQAAGQAHVDAAKADGRWDAAYSLTQVVEFPPYFLEALEGDARAKATFATLSKSARHAIHYSLTSAKRPETQQKRMVRIFEALGQGKPFRP